MAQQRKRLWIVLGSLGAVLGSCCCVGGVVGAWMALGGSSPDVPGHDWKRYTQTDCTHKDPKLSLTGFSLKYPEQFDVDQCTESSYVQFVDLDRGTLRSEFGIGWLQGAAGPPLGDWLIRQLVSQFEAGFPDGSSFRERNTTPLSARGRSLSRHDYLLDLADGVETMDAGRYAFRVVLVPNDGAEGGGLTITMMRCIKTTPRDAFDWMDDTFTPMIESIEF